MASKPALSTNIFSEVKKDCGLGSRKSSEQEPMNISSPGINRRDIFRIMAIFLMLLIRLKGQVYAQCNYSWHGRVSGFRIPSGPVVKTVQVSYRTEDPRLLHVKGLSCRCRQVVGEGKILYPDEGQWLVGHNATTIGRIIDVQPGIIIAAVVRGPVRIVGGAPTVKR